MLSSRPSRQLLFIIVAFGATSLAQSTLTLAKPRISNDFLVQPGFLERRQDPAASTVTVTDVVGEGAPVLVTAFDNPFSIVATQTEIDTVIQTAEVTIVVPLDTTAAESLTTPPSSPVNIGATALPTTQQPAMGSIVPVPANSLLAALLGEMGITLTDSESDSPSLAPSVVVTLTMSSAASSASAPMQALEAAATSSASSLVEDSESAAPSTVSSTSSMFSAPSSMSAMVQPLSAAATSSSPGLGNDTGPAAPTVPPILGSSPSSAPMFVSILTQAFSF